MAHPKITNRERVNTYVVSASTDTFPVEWPVFPKDGDETDVDVDVYVNGALKDRATWSFSGTFKDGIAAKGDVIFDAAISSGTVRIVGNIPGERSSDFSPGTVRPASLDTEFDKIWARLRELELQAKRAPKIPAYDDDAGESPFDMVLPALAGRKNKGLAFDANGRPIAGTNDVTVGLPIFNVADYGAALDGTTDDTTAINNAIDAANTAGGGIVVINGNFHVSAVNASTISTHKHAILLKSNVHLWFMPGVTGTLEPNSADGYEMIHCDDGASNFSIRGHATLTGERVGHTGSTGEWGHVIALFGNTDFVIEDVECNNGWGDGIYVGAGTQTYCLRGRILGVTCDNNRRQGMSIISCQDLEVVGCRFTNTNGTAPECGIDIEPNSSTERLRGLRIIDPYFEGNAANGVLMFLGSLRATSQPVDIVVRGLHSFGDSRGIELSTPGAAGDHVRGRIHIDHPYTELTDRSGIRVSRWDKEGPEVLIDYPVIYDPAELGPASLGTIDTTGIAFLRDSSVSDNWGNITINRPIVHDRRASPKMEYAAVMIDSLGGSVTERCAIVDPIRLEGATIADFWNGLGVEIIDTHRASVFAPNSNQSVTNSAHWPTISNKNFTATRTITLGPSLAVGTRLVFEITVAQTMTITPQAGETILVLGNGAGASVDLTVQGTRVVLRKISSTLWMPVEIIGLSPYDLVGFFGATPVAQPSGANQAALTNSTGGSQDGTLAACGDTSTADQSGVINDNFTDIHTLLDEIRTALVNEGLIKGSA